MSDSPSLTPAPAPREPSTAPFVAPQQQVRDGVEPPTGRQCKVHFRRDALGLSAPAPLGIGQVEVPGRVTHIAGTIDHVTGEWVVLRSDGKAWWIPRAAILAVELMPGQ